MAARHLLTTPQNPQPKPPNSILVRCVPPVLTANTQVRSYHLQMTFLSLTVHRPHPPIMAKEY